ncbi:lipopolysaccharide assembly protein LapB [Pleionea sp. CnH1-48]|uniref:tetratricopeptide repeat protein n=1 Tax=Pleionea sp. CnH1-48 TaxID=2954494 RepID=UPI002097F53A|nr:hypothetical protein [Pleionea sp. CnH1-48]MCO7224087.1 hypothetical protein [Pleionea sp. CnH1-48]
MHKLNTLILIGGLLLPMTSDALLAPSSPQSAATVQDGAAENHHSDYFERGKKAAADADLEVAAELFKKALELQPDNADYHYSYGMLSMRMAANASIFSAASYATDAKNHLLKSIELEPSHTRAIQGLIQFYINVPVIAGGSNKKAVAMIAKLKEVDELEGLVSESRYYRDDDDEDNMLRVAKELAQQFPSSARAMAQAGFTYQQMQRYEDAFAAFTQAVDAERMEATKSNDYYTALYQVGRTAVFSDSEHEKGIKSLSQYISAPVPKGLPDKDWAKFRLASLYYKSQKTDQAKAIITELKRKDIKDKGLRRQIKSAQRNWF